MAKKTTKRPFKIGETVKWKSTSGGVTKTKRGTIVKTIRPGTPVLEYFRPSELNPQLRIKACKYNLSKLGTGATEGREATSYLIEVSNGKNRKPYLYFPSTANLSR